MKSALTAALTGAPKAEAPKPKNVLKLDPRAFPCLTYAAQTQNVELTPVTDEAENVDLGKIQLAGSASTSHGLADYPLNPYNLRSGKERMPGMEESLARSLSASQATSNYISSLVVGSLPSGLTAEEKLYIAQSTPMSPSMNLLSELTSDKIASRTAEGRKLRRHVLRGTVVVFVTAGYSGKRFIFERAKELGVRSVVLDGPDSWVQVLEKEGIVEKFVPIDFSDADSVFARCLDAIKRVRNEIGDLDGVTTFCELAVPLVARLAEKLGLPGNTPEAVDMARDKHATRSVMQKAGLPTPRHMLVTSPEDVAKAAAHVGFPCVIKPISGAASIGVIRADDEEHLLAAFHRVLKDMRGAKIVDGALLEGDGSEDSGNAGSWINLQLMVEEYLDGEEVDCDLVFSEGACVYGAITDNWPTVEPYFNETGSNCPSILPVGQQQELLELGVKAVQALGFALGVFHVECKFTSRGARLIEVNARMGGGPVRDTNLLVWGVDLVEEHLLTAVGIPARPPVHPVPQLEVAEYSINAKVTGVLQHTNFMDAHQGHPDVLYARPLVQAGQRCVCVEDGLPTWVCELMVKKPTVAAAIDFVKEIEASLVIPIATA